MYKELYQTKEMFGPVAQLGERSVRIREVKGSNPSRSTTKTKLKAMIQLRFFYFLDIEIRPCYNYFKFE